MEAESHDDSKPSQKTSEAHIEDGKSVEFAKKTVNSTEKAVVTAYDKTKTFLEHANPRHGVTIIDAILNWDRRLFPAETLKKVVDWFSKAGILGLAAAQILAVIFFLVAAIKFADWQYVFYAVVAVVILAVLQFTADRFLAAGGTMIERSPSRLGSAAFLDCVAVIAELGGLAAFIYYFMEARQFSTWSMIWYGLVIWIVLDALAHIALNPKMVSITIAADTRAGDEALGILSFFAKALLRIVPVAFGVAIIVGDILLAWALVPLIRDMMPNMGFSALQTISMAAALPFAGYIAFALYHLTLDLFSAILAVPRKLHELKDNQKDLTL